MRLKQLDISGFKSFVDPTRITLDEGMTAIVGPNGCGKSNIVDAIRWVLGEHSARQLRGGVMDDLIFQGSDTRAPVGICDVELTFTVKKGKLSPPYHEMENIRIRRRLVRDVGSDAYINGQPVRLKDIVDIFLDTGVSTRAYAIVEQGSIARMITAKPEERRQLLEEAAGVMKYRSRRKEAEQKMKSTQQNMERVLDLLEEVRKQCNSLKQQAARAERFKDMQDEHEAMSHKALALRFMHQQQQLDGLKADWDVATQAVEVQLSMHQQTELKVAQLRRSWVMHDDEVQQAQDELRQRDQQLSELQRQAERLSGEQRLLEERQQVLQERMQEATSRQALLQADLADVEQQLSTQHDDDLQLACHTCLAQVDVAQEHVQEAREQRDDVLRQYEQLKAQYQAQAQQQVQVEKQLQRLSEQTQVLQAQQEALHVQHDEHQQQWQQAQAQLDDAQHQHDEFLSTLESAQEQAQQCFEIHQKTLQTRQQAEHLVRSIRGETQELQAQLAQQPMSEDVRKIFRDQGAVWVDEVLSLVPESLELAVAAALHGQEGDVVLPNQEVAQACQTLRQQWQDAPIALHLQNDSRFVVQGRVQNYGEGIYLATLLNIDAENPLYAVFAHVLLCDDIQAAMIPKYGCVVSRDGWCLAADGWLLPPLKNQTARRLSLQRRLHAGEQSYTEAEKSLLEAEQAVSDAQSRLSIYQQQNQQLEQDIQQLNHAMQAASAWLNRLQADADSWARREQQCQQDAGRLLQEKEQWQVQQSQLQAMDDTQLDIVKQQLDTQELMQQQYEQQWQQARAALAHAEQALALYQHTQNSLQRDAKRMQQELQQLELREQNDTSQLAKIMEKIGHNPLHEALDMQLLAAQEAADFGHQSMQQLRQQGSELQEALRVQEREEHAAKQQLQDVGQARQRIEIAQATEEAHLHDVQLDIEQHAISIEQLLDDDWAQEDLVAILKACEELDQRLRRFGAVNLLAIDEFKEASEREQFLSEQMADLEASITTLQDTIVRIDRTTRQRFKDVFEQTNAHFKQIFPQLFGGGRAELRLDSDDVLTAGVEVSAQPPGKRLQDMRLLSGGEKALTAVALVFSIFKINPAPFCILDEVDAPLDDANVVRFSDMIADFSKDVQFLAISHNKITMKKANRLIGVSMPEAGVSKIVTVDLEQIPES